MGSGEKLGYVLLGVTKEGQDGALLLLADDAPDRKTAIDRAHDLGLVFDARVVRRATRDDLTRLEPRRVTTRRSSAPAAPAPAEVPSPTPALATRGKPIVRCQACQDGVMSKSKRLKGGFLQSCLALILFLIGFVVCFTGIGIIIGVPMMLLGVLAMSKKVPVWKCRACGHTMPR